MYSLNILTISINEALAGEKCPLCRLKRIRAEKYLWHLLYENITEPLILQKYISAQGFCQEHNQLLIMIIHNRSLASCTGAATLLLTLLPDYLEEINNHRQMQLKLEKSVAEKSETGQWEHLFRNSNNWFREFSQNITTYLTGTEKAGTEKELKQDSAADCLCCQISDNAEQSYLITLAESLTLSKYRLLFLESDGLCIPHFSKLISYLDDKILSKSRENGRGVNDLLRARQFILNNQEVRLKKLQQRLERLITTKHYNNDIHLTPEEGRSWQEAIWRYTGWQPDQIISKF